MLFGGLELINNLMKLLETVEHVPKREAIKLSRWCFRNFPTDHGTKFASDLFEHNKQSYLLVMDYCSRYIEIARLHCTSSNAVINHLKSIFARHGIPQTFISDNGPQYCGNALIYQNKMTQNIILHVRGESQNLQRDLICNYLFDCYSVKCLFSIYQMIMQG